MTRRDGGLIEVTVAGQAALTERARYLTLDWRPEFLPGQMVGLQIDPQRPLRLYSIATAPGTPELGILYDVIGQGELTPRLASLKRGDRIWASPPRGEFTDRGTEAWWIANGTGIAPFLSMFRAGLRFGRTLVHGARTRDDLYFGESLAADGELNYVPCLSRSGSASDSASRLGTLIHRGRLTAWLEERIADGSVPGPPGRLYYLCGSEQMIIQVRQMMLSAGVGFERVISEIYF
jgi:ferredoxin--NADP+ reductase